MAASSVPGKRDMAWSCCIEAHLIHATYNLISMLDSVSFSTLVDLYMTVCVECVMCDPIRCVDMDMTVCVECVMCDAMRCDTLIWIFACRLAGKCGGE